MAGILIVIAVGCTTAEAGPVLARFPEGVGGKEQVRTGRFDLPKDIDNGMLIMVLKNLEKGAGTTVNILSFASEPEVFKLRFVIAGKHSCR